MGLLSGITDALFGSADAPAPPAADPNIGLAQKELAEISRDYLNMFKTEIWPSTKEAMLKQEVRADEQFQLDKAIQTEQVQLAKENRERYQKYGYPLQEQIFKEAETAGGQEDINRYMGLAVGDVKNAFGIQADANARGMKAYGIDPTSGKYQSGMRQSGITQAAAEAAAATKAYDAARQLGWAKKMDATALAQGSFGNQATSTNLALTAGNSALAAGQIPLQNAAMATNMYGSAVGTANQGWGTVGQLGVSNFGIQSQNWNNQVNQANAARASEMGFWGSLAGAGAYYGKKP